MSRSGLQNVLALPDAAQSWNFDLFFPTIPGAASTIALSYKCQTTQLPGFNLEPVDIELHGVKKKEAGRATYEHTLPSTFLEVVDFSTRDTFRMWREMIRSWKQNTGSNSQAYKVNAQIVVYDNTPTPTRRITLYGCWPETVDSTPLEGNSSTALILNVTFSYDFPDEEAL